MNKHAPGPWKVTSGLYGPNIESEDGYAIAHMINGEGSDYKANARLIAAAPKMYELLDKLRNVINDTCEHGNHSSGLMTVWNTMANDGMDLLDEIDGQEDSHE
jgi:hypothetical protein